MGQPLASGKLHRPEVEEGGVIAAFRRTATAWPDRGIDVYDRAGVKQHLTYAQVFDGVTAVARRFQAEGKRPGDRVIVALPSGFDFVSIFFGALAARLQPIPVPPPQAETVMSRYLSSLQTLAERLETTNLVTAGASEGPFLAMAEVDHGFDWVVSCERLLREVDHPGEAAPLDWSGIGGNDIAYIQCTSGSTGRRKAVALSHANLITNVRDVGEAIAVVESDIGVSWLPLYHDMGLVGSLVFGVCWGVPIVLVHPERFLRSPHEWLTAISNHGATVTLSPDFGFHYCVRRTNATELEGVDLSSLRVALCGSEPIQLPHLRRFEARFGECGLRENVIVPVYGLVEATLGVSFGRLGDRRVIRVDRGRLERSGVIEVQEDGEISAIELLSHGPTLRAVELRILGESSESLMEGNVGEIEVRGPSVMLGYVDDLGTRQKTDLDGMGSEFVMGTSATGEFVLNAEDPGSRWIATGDLGFVHEGELYVLGRVADRVVLDDRRVYPGEVEALVGRIDGVCPGSSAVFGIPVKAAALNRHDAVRDAAARAGVKGDEPAVERQLLVVACEAAEGVDRTQLAEAIAEAVQLRIGLYPHDVRVVSPHSIPKTASGKIRRFRCREFYLEQRLERGLREDRWRGLAFVTERARSAVAQMGRRLRGFFERDEV